jgi:hypothetical protein
MKSPLIVDPDDTKWLLLHSVLELTTPRKAKLEMAKQGITPVENTGSILRTILIALFFSSEITYVIEELRKRKELRTFAHVNRIPSAGDVYRFINRIDERQFIALINALLRAQSKKPQRRKHRTIIVDGSAVALDLNIFKKRIRKADLAEKDYQWGYSTTHGYYLGFKLTLAIDYPSLMPLAFLVHPGSPNDARVFPEIMDELKRRKIIRDEDTVVFDRGYYSYRNYALGVREYKIVPLIFPRKTFQTEKMMRQMNYPLKIFTHHEYRKRQETYKSLLRKLREALAEWEKYLPIRSIIEDLFKVAKGAFALRTVHRYSRMSVTKFVAMNVLLLGAVVLAGVNQKKELQRLAEG